MNLLVACSSGPTLDDLNRIEVGMSVYQVEKILGKSDKVIELSGGIRGYVYNIQGTRLIIQYENDLVKELVKQDA